MNLFDIDVLKKYQEVKDETTISSATNMLANDKKMNDLLFSFMKDESDKIKEVLIDAQTDIAKNRTKEMRIFISKFLLSLDKEDAKKVVKENLSSCEHLFNPLFEDISEKSTP